MIKEIDITKWLEDTNQAERELSAIQRAEQLAQQELNQEVSTTIIIKSLPSRAFSAI